MGEENDVKLFSFKECVTWKLNGENSCLGHRCRCEGVVPYSTIHIIASAVW